MADALRVTAWLAAPLAGDPPHLDGLLVSAASPLIGKNADPGYKVCRSRPCPRTDAMPLAVLRADAGGRRVPLTSAPVLPEPTAEWVEHVAKRIDVDRAGLLAAAERKVVVTSNTWTKSYRLPLRVRRVDRVVWFAAGDRREVMKLLRRVPGVGKKVAHGHGAVARWEVERLGAVPHPYWPWWWESPAGPVLMRALPADWPGLPAGLVGARPDFGAYMAPYWHPDNYAEVVTPC